MYSWALLNCEFFRSLILIIFIVLCTTDACILLNVLPMKCGVFPQSQTGDNGFGKNDHRGKGSFSSHHIKCPHQYDLLLQNDLSLSY